MQRKCLRFSPSALPFSKDLIDNYRLILPKMIQFWINERNIGPFRIWLVFITLLYFSFRLQDQKHRAIISLQILWIGSHAVAIVLYKAESSIVLTPDHLTSGRKGRNFSNHQIEIITINRQRTAPMRSNRICLWIGVKPMESMGWAPETELKLALDFSVFGWL
jgi:hypothetical protein